MIRSDSSRQSACSEADGAELVYLKDNVSIHPTQYVSERISGRLKLIKQGSLLFMVFLFLINTTMPIIVYGISISLCEFCNFDRLGFLIKGRTQIPDFRREVIFNILCSCILCICIVCARVYIDCFNI